MSIGNPSGDEICALLKVARTVAVVGFSPRPHRPSYRVAAGLKDAGYRVIPIRPGIHEGLGEQAYPYLDALPAEFDIDIVDVFRSAEHVPQIVDECLRRGLKTLWLQDGTINLREAERARAVGMTVIMDRCILRDYHGLCGKIYNNDNAGVAAAPSPLVDSMKLRFTKMHGLGNDFVVLDGVRQRIRLGAAQLRAIADRHLGIGCDQILLVEPAQTAAADFRYRIFNADGGEVEQCGNGARCFARFVRDKGLSDKRAIKVETLGGVIALGVEPDDRVTVNMGPPVFEPSRIPFIAASESIVEPLQVGEIEVEISALSMGNPHAVQIVDDVDSAPVGAQGPLIERHVRFPQRVNAGFMQIVDRHSIRLRVYERGAGETLACGTGACAAVVAGIRRDLLESPVTVHTRGGELTIAWAGTDNAGTMEWAPVYMTGPAETVYEGEIIVGN